METLANENRSIISLLGDISSSLAAIKDQQAALQDSLVELTAVVTEPSLHTNERVEDNSVCSCENAKATAHGESPYVRDGAVAGLDKVSNEVRDEDLVDLIAVPYEACTPSEGLVLNGFDVCYKDIIESSEVQDRLSCLPPDDFRLPVRATRGTFLRQLISNANPWNTRWNIPTNFNRGDGTELRRELLCFQNFEAKVKSGRFWIRDYDSYGCYTQWDCVRLPKVCSSNALNKQAQCKIPDCEWPVDWSNQQSTPIAPWRRIM